MTALEKLKKYKSFPSTLIINGLTYLGIQIAKTLLEQKGLVIILDKYTKENKSLIDQLSEYESFVFININGNEDLLNKIKGLNYLVYLENENIEKQSDITPKEFLEKIEKINNFLEFAINQSTKVLVTTSLKVHQLSLTKYLKKEYDPKSSIYTDIEQQRYIEKLCFNLHDKYNLNIRIIRIGEIYGPNFELSKNSILKSLIQQSIKSKYLKIRGDGLEENFIIHINDAVYGLVKALFAPRTNGEIFNLANFEDNSTLSIAYALLETNGKAKEIKFLANREKIPPAPLDPTPNLAKIGWKPRIELTKGLSEVIDILMNGKPAKKKEEDKKEEEKSLWKKIHDFFFITEEQFRLQQQIKKNKKNILDKLSQKTVKKRRVKTEPELEEKIQSKKKKWLPSFKLGKDKERQIKLNWRKYFIISLFSLIFYIFLFAPILGYVGGIASAGINGYSSIQALKENDYDKLGHKLNKLESNVQKAQDSLNGLAWIYQITGKSASKANTDKFLAAVRHLARGGKQSTKLIKPIINYAHEFSLDTEQDNDYAGYMEQIHANAAEFDVAYVELIKAQELFSKVDYESIMFTNQQSQEIKTLQADLFSKVVAYKDFIDVLPQILGYPEEKKYLVVFQNNYELRSTGGFIGSYATVDLKSGKVSNIKIDDVYNPDGQIMEEINAPEPFNEAFGDMNWKMRDANWDPDFPTSARQIEWFYDLATDEQIDGVIAINTKIIQELLEILSPITLDGKETVTRENFFELAEQHHLDFEPGSTDKKDFLARLTKELLKKLEQKDSQQLIQIGTLLEEMLEEREIFIYLNDPKAQRLIVQRNWDGGVAQHEGEYLFLIDNNLGGNKVNKYIERKISQELKVNESNIENNLQIEYINNSETDEWPGGTYQNYAQIIIPQSSKTTKIEGLRDHKTEERYNYKIISGWLEAQPQSSSMIEVVYTTNEIYNTPVNKKAFNYLIQKQSGIEDTYMDVEIRYPTNWELIKNESSLTQRTLEDKLSYFGLQNEDIKINLEFKEK